MKIKSIKKSLTALVLGGIILSNSSIALAAVTNIGGGTLYNGVTLKECYSNYYHPTKVHMSSAMNGKGLLVKSNWVNAGYTSYASVSKTLSGNQAFYSTR